MSELYSKNILLKEHINDNLEKLHIWFNDEKLNYYTDDEPYHTVTLESIKNYLHNRLMKSGLCDNNDIIHLGIHKKNEELIGFCMIAHIDNYNRKCKIGLTIGDEHEWGKGYAKEVVELLLNYCFNDLKMERIGAEIYSFNQRSIKLFQKLGFKEEGIIRNSVLKNGEYFDEYFYGLLKEEWLKLGK